MPSTLSPPRKRARRMSDFERFRTGQGSGVPIREVTAMWKFVNAQKGSAKYPAFSSTAEKQLRAIQSHHVRKMDEKEFHERPKKIRGSMIPLVELHEIKSAQGKRVRAKKEKTNTIQKIVLTSRGKAENIFEVPAARGWGELSTAHQAKMIEHIVGTTTHFLSSSKQKLPGETRARKLRMSEVRRERIPYLENGMMALQERVLNEYANHNIDLARKLENRLSILRGVTTYLREKEGQPNFIIHQAEKRKSKKGVSLLTPLQERKHYLPWLKRNYISPAKPETAKRLPNQKETRDISHEEEMMKQDLARTLAREVKVWEGYKPPKTEKTPFEREREEELAARTRALQEQEGKKREIAEGFSRGPTSQETKRLQRKYIGRFRNYRLRKLAQNIPIIGSRKLRKRLRESRPHYFEISGKEMEKALKRLGYQRVNTKNSRELWYMNPHIDRSPQSYGKKMNIKFPNTGKKELDREALTKIIKEGLGMTYDDFARRGMKLTKEQRDKIIFRD